MKRYRLPWFYIASAGEILLAVVSFLFYKLCRFCIQQLVQIHASLNKKQAWRILCAETLQQPLSLAALMTSGPRWNTHAIIAIAGPIAVKRCIRVHVSSAVTSAKSWTIVVHASPGHRIVSSIGSLSISQDETWQPVSLDPGNYRLALRYYHWTDPVELPTVEVDGVVVIPATAVPANINDFYDNLNKRSNFFYLCLHSYVCTLLRYRNWFQQSFVEREYLPAGNPQTTFYYGFLRAGASLSFDLEPHLLQTHDIYFTVYNRASFPILWYPLCESKHITLPSPVNGSYLVRLHRKLPSQEIFDRSWLRIRVQAPGKS